MWECRITWLGDRRDLLLGVHTFSWWQEGLTPRSPHLFSGVAVGSGASRLSCSMRAASFLPQLETVGRGRQTEHVCSFRAFEIMTRMHFSQEMCLHSPRTFPLALDSWGRTFWKFDKNFFLLTWFVRILSTSLKNVYDRFQTSRKVEDPIAIRQLVEQGPSNDQEGALEAFALSK